MCYLRDKNQGTCKEVGDIWMSSELMQLNGNPNGDAIFFYILIRTIIALFRVTKSPGNVNHILRYSTDSHLLFIVKQRGKSRFYM